MRLICVLGSALALAATLPAGCGGGGGSDDEQARPPARKAPQETKVARDKRDLSRPTATDEELVARASAALRLQSDDPHVLSSGHTYAYIPALAYADLAAVREELGLPVDAAIDPEKRRLLFTIAARPLFVFSTVFVSTPSLGPLGDVLDGRGIDVAAGTNLALSGPLSDEVGPEDVLVLRTRQPFAEIAGRLGEEGYEEGHDGLLVGGEPLPEPDDGIRFAPAFPRIPFPVIGDAGGGVVVFGGSSRVVRAALEDPEDELTAVAELIAQLPGVSRAAMGFRPRNCVVAVGLGESAAPREGELVVVVDGKAEAGRHRFGGQIRSTTFFGNQGGPEASEGEIVFAEAIAEEERTIARFTSTDELNATRLPIEDVQRPYDCP